MNLGPTYAYFCDDNGLRRIDASPEEKLRNLDEMATALLGMRADLLAEIADRCPTCGGTGKSSS